MTRIPALVVFLMVLTLSGCTTLEPRLVPIGEYDMVPLDSNTPVALVNVQAPGVVKIKSDTDDKDSDLSLWSARAIDLMAMWLENYNVPVRDAAGKTLRVSILEPRIHHPRHMPCTVLTIKVETSSGLTKLFPTEGCAGGNARSAGYAISYGVIEIMKDEEVAGFVNQ